MQKGEHRDLYITQKIKNIAYNAKYKLISYFEECDKDSFLSPGDTVHIFGQKMQITQKNRQEFQRRVVQIFYNTPWLTYRSGFPQLYNELVGSFVSDTGWGCMVRVGQMLFAQIIKTHKKLQTKTDILNVAQLFNDCLNNQPFSIHNIAKIARIQYGLRPGDWYNPSQISYILSQLHDKYLASAMKLKFVVFNSNNLFFDMIVQAMLEGKSQCKCQKNIKFLCEQCNTAKNGVAIIILSRIGLDGPEQKYLKILQKLMQIKSCQGVIGGKPEKALYFVGKQDQYMIYLDPHYVQDAEQNVRRQVYFCESLRKCKISAIDSSLGISFYFRDVAALNCFYKDLNEIKQNYNEDFFIYASDVTPDYMNNKIKKSIQIQFNKDESFQIL